MSVRGRGRVKTACVEDRRQILRLADQAWIARISGLPADAHGVRHAVQPGLHLVIAPPPRPSTWRGWVSSYADRDSSSWRSARSPLNGHRNALTHGSCQRRVDSAADDPIVAGQFGD